MNDNAKETQGSAWDESHPWLTQKPASEEDDTIGEVIRYSLDEMRFE